MRVMRSSRKFLPQLNLSTNKSPSVCCSGGRRVNTAPSCSKTVSASMQQASVAARLLSSAGINLWLTTGIPAWATAKCWLRVIRAAPAPRPSEGGETSRSLSHARKKKSREPRRDVSHWWVLWKWAESNYANCQQTNRSAHADTDKHCLHNSDFLFLTVAPPPSPWLQSDWSNSFMTG